ncbi:MAG: Immunoglobulin-like domain of bacterial spore germination [candidate division WS6 bacterium OLB20]|uniref:Immunoglobulin-like domain of bacterial spore germination n=1 Tax=candidate division WS6 bacterium OLB20 TaxID=1617426 RepID=A0A136LXJ1_9BACT|nr:MAG: Immunoglobulin-like domain of bacterial spore germination [candidate division WS6 bacterium OLB20]
MDEQTMQQQAPELSPTPVSAETTSNGPGRKFLIAVAVALFLIVVLILVALAAVVANNAQRSDSSGTPDSGTDVPADGGSDGLDGEDAGNIRNVSVMEDEEVSSPLTVTGEVRGWFFEGSFPVRVETSDGSVIAEEPAMTAGGADWMTAGFVPFEVTLSFDPGDAVEGVIIFIKDNPSGLPEMDERYEVPVRFSGETSETPGTETISISNLTTGQSIRSPYTVRGQAEGWFFEGEFPVKVYDRVGGTQIGLGFATVPEAAGSWTDGGMLPFTADVYFVANARTEGVIVLEKNNPSGLPENDESVSIPVRFAPEDIRITNVLPYQEIPSGFAVSGSARGPWFFEASFPFSVQRLNGTVVYTTPVPAIGDSYTTSFVPFSVSVGAGPGSGQTALLVFEKANASGLPEHADSFEIPVRFR